MRETADCKQLHPFLELKSKVGAYVPLFLTVESGEGGELRVQLQTKCYLLNDVSAPGVTIEEGSHFSGLLVVSRG